MIVRPGDVETRAGRQLVHVGRAATAFGQSLDGDFVALRGGLDEGVAARIGAAVERQRDLQMRAGGGGFKPALGRDFDLADVGREIAERDHARRAPIERGGHYSAAARGRSRATRSSTSRRAHRAPASMLRL
jgi:hypothetical protein